MLVKTSELSSAEHLKVQRRRKGLSQRNAAADLGVSMYHYLSYENGAEGVDVPKKLKRALGKLSKGEQCYVMRARTGKSLTQIASKIDCCTWQVTKMETDRAPAKPLIDYWS